MKHMLPPQLPGHTPQERWLNKLREAIEATMLTYGRGIQVRKTPIGTTLEADPKKGGTTGEGEPVWL